MLLEAVWAPVVPSRTRLTPPPQSWEILCLFLSPLLFFYIKCLFASNFFQVPLLLSAKPWLSSTASANPLSPLSLPRTSYRHISLEAMECRTFFHLNGLGRRAANVQWGKKRKYRRKNFQINFKTLSSCIKITH